MPTYTVVAIGTGVSSTGSMSVTPGTHAAGDLLLLWAAARSNTEVSDVDPSGYTLLSAGPDNGCELWGKIAASSSEGAVSISFDGASRCGAFITTLRCSTGWPAIGSVVSGAPASGISTVSGTRYRSLTVATDNGYAAQWAVKSLTTGDVNVASSVAVTGGFEALGFVSASVATSVVVSGQGQSQTTATNLTQNDAAITTNTDSASARGLSLLLLGNADSASNALRARFYEMLRSA